MHSVVTLRRNSELTRVTCAGIVDADDYDLADVEYLKKARYFDSGCFRDRECSASPGRLYGNRRRRGLCGRGRLRAADLASLKEDVFATLRAPGAIERVVVRYCRRRIDRALKKIDLSEAASVVSITAEYSKHTAGLDIAMIANVATERINHALQTEDLPLLLAHYDNKALLSIGSQTS